MNGAALLDADVLDRLLEVLSEEGRRRWQDMTDEEAPTRSPAAMVEATPTLSDRPAKVDLLGRNAFARVLAVRINRMREKDDRPLFILLHGPWGSGKSTVLELLDQNLRRSPSEKNGAAGEESGSTRDSSNPCRWLVVNFNAWQYQKISPAWLSIMDAIYDQSRPPAVTRCERLRLWWRYFKLRKMTPRNVVLAVLSIAIAFVFAAIFLGSGEHFSAVIFGGNEKPAAANGTSGIEWKEVLAVISGVIGFAGAVLSFMGTRLEQTAQNLLGSRPDPLRQLERRFRRIIEAIVTRPRPDEKDADKACRHMALFVDDLDRCTANYVVDFLEAAQTLLANLPITVVVAADGHWVRQGFEVAYQDFRTAGNNTDASLGYRFLEKTFQMTVVVPHMAKMYKQRFWRSVLRNEVDVAPAESAQAGTFESTKSEQQVFSQLEKIREDPSLSDDAVRGATQSAVVRLADSQIEREVEHRLDGLLGVTDDNPRNMKRLVMAYGMNRARDLLEGRITRAEVLALWTAFCLRWPELAEWLEQYPSQVDLIRLGDPDGIAGASPEPPLRLRPLFRDRRVRAVLAAEGLTGFAPIDSATLAEMVGTESAGGGANGEPAAE